MMRIGVTGIAIAAPGLAGWNAARRVLSGESEYVQAPLVTPAVHALPAAERRRAGPSTRLAVGVAQEAVAAAGVDAATLASVFASADGDSENLHHICLALANPLPEISPTRFHNSVQNAASGYWSIAMQARAPTTTLTGFDDIFATALVEAAAQVVGEERDVLVVAYDLPMPAPLHALHPVAEGAAVALVLAPGEAPASAKILGSATGSPARSIATLALALTPANETRATKLRDPTLESLRLMRNPALRSLPLLVAIARGERAQVFLDLDGAQALQIDVAPRALRDPESGRAAARA